MKGSKVNNEHIEKKNEFVSIYKCRLKHNYGDLDKVLSQCEHSNKNFCTPKEASKLSFSFDLRKENTDEDNELVSRSILNLTHGGKSNSVSNKRESEIKNMNKTQVGSAYFRGITREKWQRLFNSGKVNVPVGIHNPKYAVLQR